MGISGRPELKLLLLCTIVFCLEARLVIFITFQSQRLSWDAARQYCQKNHIDMVTWHIVDPNRLTTWLEEEGYTNVWMGLHEDPEQQSVWRWINVKTGEGLTGDDVSQSKNWVAGQPFDDSCCNYNIPTKKWYSKVCSHPLPFNCYEDNLVLVSENKTWEDALNHCRQMTNAAYKYDLLSARYSSDFSYVRDRIYRATTEEVWTGLRFLGGEWWWSDGETLHQQETLPDCPSQWEHCGAVSKYNTTNWISRDCSERRNFICYYKKV